MNALTQLNIQGFKSIRKLENLTLGQINVLIGPNGAGKSNLLDFFRMLNWMVTGLSGNFQNFVSNSGGANRLLFEGEETSKKIEARLAFQTKSGHCQYTLRLCPYANDTLVFFMEELKRSGIDGNGRVLFSETNYKETKLIDKAHDYIYEEDIRNLMEASIVYHFHNTSETSRIRNKWDVNDGHFLKKDGGNLAPFLYRLKKMKFKYYQRIVETIRLLLPFFDDFVFEHEQKSEKEPEKEGLLLQWREQGSDLIYSPYFASDGTLRIMALVTLLLVPQQSQPQILIIDEPELSLHPHAIEIIMGLIKSVSLSTQVILATQSAALVDRFDPKDIIVVERKGRESIFKRLETKRLKEWLDEYSLAELWEKNVIGGRPYK